MFLLLLFFSCFTNSSSDYVSEYFRAKALLENPVIPNRLLEPFYNESIVHIWRFPNRILNVNSDKDPLGGPTEPPTELVSECSQYNRSLNPTFASLPATFPRFLCALSFLYQQKDISALAGTSDLFADPQEATLFLNDPSNYPCRQHNLTDVVALVPNRIYSGCVSDTNPRGFNRLSLAFVMSHPFPEPKNCTKRVPMCEMRSMILERRVAYQQKDCCCESDSCAVLIFSQTKSITPLVIKTIDLEKETLTPTKEPAFPEKTTTMRHDKFPFNKFPWLFLNRTDDK